jgi:ABC-type transport system involved in multi-copper enzyme maturation permease subunit
MSVVTPHRSQVREGRDGFAQLLWAEWTKFRTVRGWLAGLAVGALLIVGLSALTGANSHCSFADVTGQNPNPAPKPCPAPPAGPGGEWVSDSFYFVRQPLAGNGSITVRATSLTGLYSPHGGLAAGPNLLAGMKAGVQAWTKAGIIIKASTAQGSAYAAMMVTGHHGVRMQWNFTNDKPGLAGKVSARLPRWLRLSRSGDEIKGYDSADGTHWTLVGTAALPGLRATAQAGLFAAAPGYSVTSASLGGSSAIGGPTLATVTFDQVSLQGTWPVGRWTGNPVGGRIDVALPPSVQGFTRAGGRFTVSGSGDIAPTTGADAGSHTVQQALAGVFAGLIAMMVVGVMFMTAEYRRGLIGTTLTASPRRGRVLAAKAIVLGAVTFVAGLIAVAIAIPLGQHLLHDNGNPILQPPALTTLRIVVGTAALLAVAAVLALGVGTLLRRSAAAVTAVIAGIVLPYLLAVLPGVLPLGAEEWLVRVTPAAAFAVEQSARAYSQVVGDYTPATGYFPLAPWAGFAVLCGWAAIALGLAAYVLRRRDV